MNKDLIIILEINKDLEELRELGLSEEELEGYLEFFIDDYGLEEEIAEEV